MNFDAVHKLALAGRAWVRPDLPEDEYYGKMADAFSVIAYSAAASRTAPRPVLSRKLMQKAFWQDFPRISPGSQAHALSVAACVLFLLRVFAPPFRMETERWFVGPFWTASVRPALERDAAILKPHTAFALLRAVGHLSEECATDMRVALGATTGWMSDLSALHVVPGISADGLLRDVLEPMWDHPDEPRAIIPALVAACHLTGSHRESLGPADWRATVAAEVRDRLEAFCADEKKSMGTFHDPLAHEALSLLRKLKALQKRRDREKDGRAADAGESSGV